MILQLLTHLILLPSALLALGLAAFVLTRDRMAWTNRLLAAGLGALAAYQGLMLAAEFWGSGTGQLFLMRLALGALTLLPPTWLGFCLAFGKSNGESRLATRRAPLLCLIALVPLAWAALAAGYFIRPVRVEGSSLVLLGLDVCGKVFFSVYLVALAFLLLNVENLYRHSSRDIQHRIRFLVVGLFFGFGTQIVAASLALLYGSLHPLEPVLGAAAFLVAEAMIAFALVRHRLMSVDIFISRYIIYRSLTLGLVGAYLLLLGLAAEALLYFDLRLDLFSGTFLAMLGGAALALILLSATVQAKAKAFIHAHFYKHKYDYHAEWLEFTHRLSTAPSPAEIAEQTLVRILEVMWVRHAALYAIDESARAVRLIHQRNAADLPPTQPLSRAQLEALRECMLLSRAPSGQDAWLGATSALARELFPQLPIGCAVPVAALDSLIGLLLVGPEQSGRQFGRDDHDLLIAVATQAGALILNARLSREAAEGREMQLLARFSAFVAHDLKNAVSMLAMLAENARHHMSKPEFQADATRTLGDVTAKMRTLLAALTSPSRSGEAERQSVSPAPTVEGWVQQFRPRIPDRIRLETGLGWAPDVRVDPEQLRSVVQNLILNAVEAIPNEGTIRIEIFQENGSAILAVIDTGRGMSPDFIRDRLFRPFQTTKPRGLGIGLYQCRQIIHGLGGTITAESEEGKGTRMIVRLPAAVACEQATEVR